MLVLLLVCAAVALPAQAPINGPVVLLVGAPGAGKSTQAAALSKAYGLPVVRAEDLVKDNPAAFQKMREAKITGMDPLTDPVLNRLFDDRLAKGDLNQGLILAGYPATKDHADHLQKLVAEKKLPPPQIVQLDIPDNEARKRLAGDPDFPPEKVEQLLKDYHREFDLAHLYFPDSKVTKVDGTASPEQVTRKIRTILDPVVTPRKR